MDDDDSCWFEKIPLEEFDDDKSWLMQQLGATKWNFNIEFYREIRSPQSLEDLLKHMEGHSLIWMKDGTFILPKRLPRHIPRSWKYCRVTMCIDFAPKSVHVYGIDNDIVARSTAQFLCFKDKRANGGRMVRIWVDLGSRAAPSTATTTFVTPHFLRGYIEANPQRRLILGAGCHLSREQSVTLTSHHEPLDVGLECTFEDNGRTFVETLAGRTSDFGTLLLWNDQLADAADSDFSFLDEIFRSVSQIALITTSAILKGSQFLLPLTSPARRIDYTISGSYDVPASESFTIVPRAVRLKFLNALSAPLVHTKVLQASGNVRELALLYDGQEPSAAQQKEILDAIAMNEKLYRLELGHLNFATIWEELVEVMGSHGSLQVVVFRVRESDLLQHHVKRLVAFMTENIHLDISLKYRFPHNMKRLELVSIFEPTRLRNHVKVLARVSAQDRAAVFCVALTNWAAGDVSKIAVLLSENSDLLCSIDGTNP